MKEKATIFDYARMCGNFEPDCGECPMYREPNVRGLCCGDFVKVHPDKANEIILKWCKEHPVETRQDRFLKMFPNAPVSNGLVIICPERVDTTYKVDSCSLPCMNCYKKYWLAEVEEDE